VGQKCLSNCQASIAAAFPVIRANGVLELEPEWHQLRLTVAEMIHFIRQLEAWSQLEVIECSWKKLMDFVNKKEGDLDALINAHRTYLEQLVRQMLLLSNKTGREASFRIPVKICSLNDVLGGYVASAPGRFHHNTAIPRRNGS